MSVLFRIAWNNVLQNQRRTGLLSLAVGSGVFILVLLMGLGGGIRQLLEDAARALVGGDLTVIGAQSIGHNRVVTSIEEATRAKALLDRSLPAGSAVSVRGETQVMAFADKARGFSSVLGIDLPSDVYLKKILQMSEGEISVLNQPRQALLFEAKAKELNVQVGDSLTLVGRTWVGVINSVDVTVGAIAKDIGALSANFILVSHLTYLEIVALPQSSAVSLFVYLPDPQINQSMMPLIADLLTHNGFPQTEVLWSESSFDWYKRMGRVPSSGQKLAVMDRDATIGGVRFPLRMVSAVTGGATLVMFLLVFVGLMNTLFLIISERASEIGTMRAIGFQRHQVVVIFMLESIFLAGIASGIGAMVGAAACLLLSALHLHIPPGLAGLVMQDRLVLAIQVRPLVTLVLWICGAGALAGLFAARRAASVRPILSLEARE